MPGHDSNSTETERVSPRYSGIDLWKTSDVLDALIEGQFGAVAAVRAARASLESAALAIEGRVRYRGRLVYAGAGTSGRLAVQDGAELMPTFNWPEERLVLLIAGGKDALVRSVEGAEDEVGRAERLIREHVIDGKDVLIAVAASGTTPFTLACLREAKARGALTIGIANNPGTPILQESDHPVLLDTGPEPIAGSTRMKAGTAQKIALNMLSTLAAIHLGHVHDGYMVNLFADNIKLRGRAARIVAAVAGCDEKAAHAALEKTGGRVKQAILVAAGAADVNAAEELLDRTGSRLRP
ncbi:MAG TPA: N-acetylmuramic acid 6-phosphate etherase, partial [Pseudorhodoplanes sp.]|nr:N-acetylmuramic acid 6-phosphate etherase [Pseudorhodoplanes sp.]